MASVKQKSISGLAWDLVGTFSRHGIGLIISIFLARLLEPAEFGLVAMAMVFVHIMQVFVDYGFASALIQNKENTSLTYSSVFYINILAGIALCGIFQLSAPLIGKFYDHESVPSLIRWLSLSFIFSSVNSVQRHILLRKIDFKTLTIRSMISQVISGAIGVYLAFNGWGAFAIVAQNLLASLINTLILWRVTEWYPKLEFSIAEVKKLTGFSVFMFFNRLSVNLFQQLDTLFIVKIFSPTTLGYFSRAESLNSLIHKYSSASLSKVFFPVLSKFQDDRAQFNQIYIKVVSVACFISFYLAGVLYLFGEEIIVTLFSDKWLPSVHIFQILILRGFTHPLNSMIVNAYLSLGKSRENFLLGLVRKATCLIYPALGYFYGLEAFLIGSVVVHYALTIFNIYFAGRLLVIPMKLHFAKIFEGIIPLVALICFLVFQPVDALWLKILLGSFYTFVYYIFNFYIKNEGLVFIQGNLKQYLARFDLSYRK